MKILSKSRLQKISKAAVLWFTLTGWFFPLLLSGCGSGGGNTAPPPEDKVSVKGTVVVDAHSTPVSGASCRFVDLHGVEQAGGSADEKGAFTLNVPADNEGYLRCSPAGLDNLYLSAYCNTRGLAPGDTLEDEDVTIFSTLAAQIMATEEPADPVGRNADLLAAMDGGQDLALNLVVTVATRLYSAMLNRSLNMTFAGDAGGNTADGNGIGGQVDTGGQSPDSGETSVVADAQCTFIADNNLGDGGSLLYPSALADFYDDGRLGRSDLTPIHSEINEQNIGQEEEIADAFKQVFAAGLGPAFTATTDADGLYFMAVPPNVSGYVRCVPKEQKTLVLAAYVPGRPKDESLEGQDVNPATTLHAQRIAARLRNLAEQQTTKENYLKDISGLETQVLYDDQAVAGFKLRSGTAPAEKNVGLAAFSATALYNLLYRNDKDGDYLALLDAFCRERGLDPETLADQGLMPEEARAFTELLDQAIAQTQSTLGTLLDDALSTARINVRVSEFEGGSGLPGAMITLADDIACNGCGGRTDNYGDVFLNLGGVTDSSVDLTVVARDAEGHEATETVNVVPLATVETHMVMLGSYTLTIQMSGNGSGYVFVEIDGQQKTNCFLSSWSELDTCSPRINPGATISLIAEPYNKTYEFTGWQSSACNHTEPFCSMTMDQDQTITANFSYNCSNSDFREFLTPRWGETFSSIGGNNVINVSFNNECDLAVHSDVDWISIGNITEEENTNYLYKKGLRSVAYSVAANPEPNPRTGTITVLENPIVITQDGSQCATAGYEITPVSTTFTAAGGSGAMEVRAPEGCPWRAAADCDWITITSGSGEHSGSGTLTYAVPENPGAKLRVGNINLFGKHHVVAQAGLSWPQVHGVTIQGEGDGSGTVFSEWFDVSPGTADNSHFNDIECRINNANTDGKCHAIFRTNTYLLLHVQPDPGSLFLSWSGACNQTVRGCETRISANTQSIGARFTRLNEAELLSQLICSDAHCRFFQPLYIGEENFMESTITYFSATNQGVEDAGPFSIGFYISSDRIFDESDSLILDSRIYLDGLAAGEKQVFHIPENMSFPANLTPGRAYLGVIVDDLNNVTEDFENNNADWVEVELLAPAQAGRGANK